MGDEKRGKSSLGSLALYRIVIYCLRAPINAEARHKVSYSGGCICLAVDS